MKYYRYGKFKPCDYCISWIGITMLLLFSIASIIFNLSFLFVVFPIVYAAIWLWRILAPHSEWFVLCDDSIIAFSGKNSRKIIIPSELTLIISYVDISPPLAKRTATGNQTHILKDQYAVSIFQKMPLDFVLESIHRGSIQKYTTSTIQTVFDDYQYIYSFVCTQSLLNQLITRRNCILIIPESLSAQVSASSNFAITHIDKGF